MAQFYANENFPLPAVEELRRLGHDVLTTYESGRAGLAIPDDEVLRFATTTKRIVLTINRKHFIRLHQTQTSHSGIVACTFDSDFVALAHRVHTAISTQLSMDGQLVRVNRPG